ncbi:MAG: response regulator [Chitinophagaceae bacterium]|nr:response regulator [Chitinophagaceae bacterium]
MTSNKTYAIIEDAQDVCSNIERRMQKFPTWQLVKSTGYLHEALEVVKSHHPDLLFLDWEIKGGNTFEILDYIKHNNQQYQPYIIFFTGYKNEVSEITTTLINLYKVNKFIEKPIFENLTQYLAKYLHEANDIEHLIYQIIIPDIHGDLYKINPQDIVCVVSNEIHKRYKDICLNDGTILLTKKTFDEIKEILTTHQIEFNFPNKRESIAVKKYIKQIIGYFVYFHDFKMKVEINQENLVGFKKWFIE